MSTFRQVERQSLSEKIASATEEAIIAGIYRVGARLPAEQALAAQFGVSRNVVREGLRLLQERGLLETRNGSGAYILPPGADATSNALTRYIRLTDAPDHVQALYEARCVLEGANARLAAERANEEDLAAITGALERMRDHGGSVKRWAESDLEFHRAVSRAAHSTFLGMLLEPLVGQLRDVIVEGFQVPGAMQAGFEDHVLILESIRNRQPDGAHAAMLYHLQQSEKHVRERPSALSNLDR